MKTCCANAMLSTLTELPVPIDLTCARNTCTARRVGGRRSAHYSSERHVRRHCTATALTEAYVEDAAAMLCLIERDARLPLGHLRSNISEYISVSISGMSVYTSQVTFSLHTSSKGPTRTITSPGPIGGARALALSLSLSAHTIIVNSWRAHRSSNICCFVLVDRRSADRAIRANGV